MALPPPDWRMLVFVALLSGSLARAGDTPGSSREEGCFSLKGTVYLTSEANRAASGVEIVMVQEGSSEPRKRVFSDARGQFEFKCLRKGKYEFRAQKKLLRPDIESLPSSLVLKRGQVVHSVFDYVVEKDSRLSFGLLNAL